MIPNHLSYSSVNLYTLCPRSFRFRYIDKVQTPTSPNLVFGSAFHGAIEDYIVAQAKAGQVDTPTLLTDLWAEHWQKQLADKRNADIAWGDKSADEFAALGKRMLKNQVTVTGGGPERKMTTSQFLDGLAPMIEGEGPVIEKRVEMNVPGVPVPIIGYIDMIAADGVPVDFKTASRAWYADKAKQEKQPDFYLAALNQTGLAAPDGKFRYIVFTKTKSPKIQVIETKRTVADLFWLFGMITEIWQAIEAGVFPPNTTTWKCSPKWCDYWPMCRGGKA